MNKIGFTVKLRLASGVHVITVPAEIVKAQGWKIGDEFEVRLVKKRKRGK